MMKKGTEITSMKKLLKRLIPLLVLLLLLAAGTAAAYADQDVTLKLDGKTIKCDVPPIIQDGRTLVPVRALSEAMGANVGWDPAARMVSVSMGDYDVRLYIDSKTAYVNGAAKSMDVPAQIVNSRTLIPLRFAAEGIGCEVQWDGATRTVSVKSPAPKPVEQPPVVSGLNEIQSVGMVTSSSGYRVVITAAGDVSNYKTMTVSGPERFIVDIPNARLPQGMGNLQIGNSVISAIRYSQFDAASVRVVVDLMQKEEGKVSLSADKNAIYVDFAAAGTGTDLGVDFSTGTDTGTGSGSGTDIGTGTGTDPDADTPPAPQKTYQVANVNIPKLDSRLDGLIIAVDMGHGGTDVGSQGKIDGKVVLNEKDVNLEVGLRLGELLEKAGANVILLRNKDASMTLYSRPDAANALDADLFVSIHNNSNESPDPNGTEVHFCTKSTEARYGIFSKEVAKTVQSNLVKTLGLKNRGYKSSPELAVLNRTKMPAILIEGAFISNPDELDYMLSDVFVENYARGAAKGIIEALNAAADSYLTAGELPEEPEELEELFGPDELIF